MNFVVSPRQLVGCLILISASLCLVSLLGQFTTYFLGDPLPTQLLNKFNVDQEYNLPTLYSGGLLLFCSLLLLLIAIAEHQQMHHWVWHWLGLAFVFLYLGLDECLQLHETLNRFLQSGSSSRWDLSNMLFTLVLGVVYSKFLLKLDRKPQRLMLLSATVFIFGAVAIEIIASKFYPMVYHQPTFGNELITTLEEFLEMLGAAIFSYSLLVYLRDRVDFIHINLK